MIINGINYKKCSKCGKVFTTDYFFSNKSRNDGYSACCKSCHMADGNLRLREKRNEIIMAYGGKCEDCDVSDIRVLQFDHKIRGQAKIDYASGGTHNFYKLLMPVNHDKYAVLCANHNWKKRFTEKQLYKDLSPLIPVDNTYNGKTKYCPGCKQTYKTEDFYVNIARSDNLTSYCKTCHNVEGDIRERKLRAEILERYGAVCNRCGIADPEMLHVGHVNYGGGNQRKTAAHYQEYYRTLLTLPHEELEIQCANCNFIKMYEEGEHFKTLPPEEFINSRFSPEKKEKFIAMMRQKGQEFPAEAPPEIAAQVVAATKVGGKKGVKRPQHSEKMKAIWAERKEELFSG